MKIDFTDRVLDALEDTPPAVRKAFRKQLGFLAENLHHPSLRAKKYDEARGLWQARVTRGWRFYFKIAGDTYRLEEIKKHPKK
jgi:mRNA-degrading endonuclease RelE of RelBE toxin-antitoxin system